MDADKELKKDKPKTSKQHSNEELTEKYVKGLMNHSSYKRRGGAIRQVRQG